MRQPLRITLFVLPAIPITAAETPPLYPPLTQPLQQGHGVVACAGIRRNGAAAPSVSWLSGKRGSILHLENQEMKLESNHPGTFGCEMRVEILCESYIMDALFFAF
jgi:hypothetical protein